MRKELSKEETLKIIKEAVRSALKDTVEPVLICAIIYMFKFLVTGKLVLVSNTMISSLLILIIFSWFTCVIANTIENTVMKTIFCIWYQVVKAFFCIVTALMIFTAK